MKTKLHEPAYALSTLAVAYLASALGMLLAGPGTGVAMIFAGILVLIPYLVPFAWFGGSEARNKFFDPIWVKVALLFLSAVYIALSASWASSILNLAFGVPASNFPITLALIALAYLPGKLLGPVVTLAMIGLSLTAYTGANRTSIPALSGHPFRFNPDTDSGINQPVFV